MLKKFDAGALTDATDRTVCIEPQCCQSLTQAHGDCSLGIEPKQCHWSLSLTQAHSDRPTEQFASNHYVVEVWRRCTVTDHFASNHNVVAVWRMCTVTDRPTTWHPTTIMSLKFEAAAEWPTDWTVCIEPQCHWSCCTVTRDRRTIRWTNQ